MASNLGQIFVELQLNDAPYKQRLSETLTSTEATAKGIETSWRALGTKSEAVFDSQRKAAENAYTLIKNSATTSAADILRAEEAKNSKITQLNDQQFGTQESLLDKFKSNWVLASVAIVAALGTVAKAKEYIEIGAKAEQASESFRLVAGAAGESSDRILLAMKRSSAGTVDDSDIMQKAVKGMVLGLSGDQMVAIMEAARISARIAGVDVQTAYEEITNAIATEMPKALKAYGLISKQEIGLVTQALAAGVEGGDLYGIAMAHAGLQAAKFGEIHVTVAEQLQILKANSQEIREEIGTNLVKILGGVYDSFRLTAAAALYLASSFPMLISGIEELRAANAWLAGDKERYEGLTKSAKTYWQTSIDMQGAAGDLYEKVMAANLVSTETSKAASKEEIALKQLSLDAEKAKLVAAIATAEQKKLSLEAMKASDKSYFQEQEILIKSNADLMKAHYSDDYDIAKATQDAKLTVITEFYARSKAEIAAESDARTKAEKDKVSDATFTANKMVALNADVNKQRLEANTNFTNAAIQLEGKWLAQKRDLGLTSTEISLRELQREYESFSKITQDKNSLDEWYASKKRAIDAALANEIIGIYKALYEEAVKRNSLMAIDYLNKAVDANNKIIANDKSKWVSILGNADDAATYQFIKERQFVNDFVSGTQQMAAASTVWAAETVKATDTVVVGMNNSQLAVASLSASLIDAQSHLSGFPINLGSTTGTPAVSAPTGAYTGAGAPIVGVSGGVTITTIGGLSVQQYNVQQAAVAAAAEAAAALYALQQAQAAAIAASRVSIKRVIDKVYTIGSIQGYFIWSDGTLTSFKDGGTKYPAPITIQGTIPDLTVVAKAVTQKGYTAPPGSWFADTPDKGQIAFSDGSVKNYASGGWITEPIQGVGRSGRRYELGENGPEMVTPAGKMGGGSTTNVFRIYLDGEEIKGRIRVVADKVIVDRNKSGINSTTRVYQ